MTLSTPPTIPSAPDLLLHERDARGVHRLTLNNPGSFNTLSEAMLTALQKALDAIAQDEQARVVVLGAAGKAFCAGHNQKCGRSPNWSITKSGLPSARA